MRNSTKESGPLHIKYLTPGEVRAYLTANPKLIVPVGVTEHHGPHLPMGCDTIIVERLADDLSAEFRVVRAPTVEYGVGLPPAPDHLGSASVRRKTLHRFMNDLVGDWEETGVEQFIILTANGHEAHQEALTTLNTRQATVQTVDIFGVPLGAEEDGRNLPIHGGQIDTSLLLYLAHDQVALELAEDFIPTKREVRRYRRGTPGAFRAQAPGSVGRPTLATVERGAELYKFIYSRIASHVFAVGTVDHSPPGEEQ
jgi:creatinine amidohydrolase